MRIRCTRRAERPRDRPIRLRLGPKPCEYLRHFCDRAMVVPSVRTQHAYPAKRRIRSSEAIFASALRTHSVELRGLEPLTHAPGSCGNLG